MSKSGFAALLTRTIFSIKPYWMIENGESIRLDSVVEIRNEKTSKKGNLFLNCTQHSMSFYNLNSICTIFTTQKRSPFLLKANLERKHFKFF